MDKAVLIQEELINIFSMLRRKGLAISIGELLDALRVLESHDDSLPLDQLQKNVQLLWLSGSSNIPLEIEFRTIWKTRFSNLFPDAPVIEVLSPEEIETGISDEPEIQTPALETDSVSAPESPVEEVPPEIPEAPVEDDAEEPLPNPEENSPNTDNWNKPYKKPAQNRNFSSPPKITVKSDAPGLSVSNVLPLPVSFDHNSIKGVNEIFAYKPISKLSMAYAWRYLRRPVPDGPADVLDIDTTIKLVANQGFFLTPLYRRRMNNHAHLILLIDEGGSMVPFRYIIHDLIETTQYESSIKLVDVFYFHNYIDDQLYTDQHLLESVNSSRALENCTANTSILIVSDAGAARGFKSFERIRKTLQMYFRLKQRTNLIAWLNPMPESRWKDSSAEFLAESLQMFQMDSDGFSNAVDALQGRGTVA